MNGRLFWICLLPLAGCLATVGCQSHVPHEQKMGAAPYDRPFPLGQVTDAHWETQQTNAEAAKFIFFDHEFVGDTAKLGPAGTKHLWQVGLRLSHVPFPVIIEESPDNRNPRLDQARRETIVDHLSQMGLEPDLIQSRVGVAPAFPEGLSAIEGEAAYYSTIGGSDFGVGGGAGRRFSGRGGHFR